MTDEEFLIAFESARLSPPAFDHRAHLRAAWLMLRSYSLEEAVHNTCHGIERLATRFGAREKFHRSVSEAIVRLMSRAIADHSSQSFDEFLRANPWLLGDIRAVLAEYYSSSQLYSERAKQHFVPPDLKPLP